ncbi:MAG: bifunctional metallophosphatase/5'-nucleotidase [Oligoflexia bacterium]|nr:bifunctional metallophosphatase/5'-nucleotidase [Oligoflexia bacterium]
MKIVSTFLLSLLLLTFLISSTVLACVSGEECTISGVVKGPDSKPIKGLSVAPCSDQSQNAVTDVKGVFVLKYTLSSDSDKDNTLCINGNKGIGRIAITNKMGWGGPEKSITVGWVTYPVVTTINFLHFNDAHGAIDNFPKIVAEIKRLKRENKNTFVFDAGDNFSGNPIVDQAADKGKPFFDLMNAIPIDAMAIGNHDFDYGQKVLLKRIKESSFPLLSANIKVVSSDASIPQPKAYTTLTTDNGIKIAVISAIETSNNGRPATLPKNVEGLYFSNAGKEIAKYSFLKSDQKANLVLALTHLGSSEDYKLAEANSFIDVIIGGHSHTYIKKNLIINNAIVVQAGDELNYLGKIVVTLSNGKVTSKKNQIIDLKTLTTEDSTIRTMVDKYNSNPVLAKAIGYADQTISGNNELGSLITDAIMTTLKADIAFQNNGGIRINNISAGKISLRKAYELLPFGNQIVLMKMSTDEIRSLISYSYNKRKSIDLQVAGIKYVVKDGGSTVELLDYSNRPILEDKTYIVAMNDYIATGYKFVHQDSGQSTNMADNDLLIKFIKDQENLNYNAVIRASSMR